MEKEKTKHLKKTSLLNKEIERKHTCGFRWSCPSWSR